MIPLSIPYIKGSEWRYVKHCLDTGWVSSAGKYVNDFEAHVSSLTKSKFAVSLTSGTAALHIALVLAGLEAGEEVIVPTVTFIAPINTVRYFQAEPIFMDADRFYNIDAEKTIEFIHNQTIYKNGATFNKSTKKRIRAIIPVHVFGNAVNLADLNALCKKRNITVLEDATESLGTFYRSGKLKGKSAGTIGDFGCLSFNGNKIITTGGGGMILTNNAQAAKEAKYLTTQAKDDELYYVHNSVGYNYRLTNIQSAIGIAQLEQLKKIIQIKKANFDTYKRLLSDIDGLYLADVPDYADNNYWMYALQIDAKRYGLNRDVLLRRFQQEKIETRPLWYLNHWQKPYQHCQKYKIENAKVLWENTLNIPCSANLTTSDIQKIIGLLRKWKKS